MKPVCDCISDLHMGDGGPRDNFAYGSRACEFNAFLDAVEAQGTTLVICGDLFEFWQANLSAVITYRKPLLDRLARLGAIYIPGNHDADLSYFIGRKWLTHPFFRTMRLCHTITVAYRTFHFYHGHEEDPYCCTDRPGIGRISAIYAGLKEDRNGGPMLDKHKTVEDMTVGRIERCMSAVRKLFGLPGRVETLNARWLRRVPQDDAIVFGHTHSPGQKDGKLFNCGSWAETRNGFVRIYDDGSVHVMDWINCQAVPNETELRAP